MKVLYQNQELGEVIEVMDNSAYLVFTVLTNQQEELMIPNVDKYVKTINDTIIHVDNIDELRNL